MLSPQVRLALAIEESTKRNEGLREALTRCEKAAEDIAALLDDEKDADTVATNSAWDYAMTIQEVARDALAKEET